MGHDEVPGRADATEHDQPASAEGEPAAPIAEASGSTSTTAPEAAATAPESEPVSIPSADGGGDDPVRRDEAPRSPWAPPTYGRYSPAAQATGPTGPNATPTVPGQYPMTARVYHPYPGTPGGYPPGADATEPGHQPTLPAFAAAQPPDQLPQPMPGRRLLFLALVMVLLAAVLGGGVGGMIGYRMAAGGLNVLDLPLPGLDSAGAPATAVEAVAQRVLPTVVQLRVRAGQQASAGSGMIVSADGLILTNNHVIESAAGGAGQIVVLFQDAKIAPARIVGRDPSSDVAVVRAQNVSGLRPIELGNSDPVRVGQQVVAVGSPLGLGGTVTTGIVSALDRAVSVGRDNPSDPADPGEVLNAIQTDAAINPGNSGGPLVDMDGRLIGINTAIASIGGSAGEQSGSVGLGFSIPINQVKRVADELVRTGQATKAVLGVGVGSSSRLSPLLEQPGARLVQVRTPDSPAARAGLKVGDVIIKVDERPVTRGDELVAAIRAHAPGDTVRLLLSDGRTVSAVLDGEPVLATK
ncbi:MAG: trypsin-like peptidase domain-containing protein [Pseudonocardia sp.]|nr:trypsin-like peptidase domain-containing protein [Pseudonocardia sp.]